MLHNRVLKTGAFISVIIPFLMSVSGCTALMQSMAESYIEGSPVADYAYIHDNPEIGDSAFYINQQTPEGMPSPIIKMVIEAQSPNNVNASSESLPPVRSGKDSFGDFIRSPMPEMRTYLTITQQHEVTEAYMMVADKRYNMKVTKPGKGNPILSRKVTVLDKAEVLTIGEKEYLIDRIMIEHWRTDEHKLEWLLIKHMSPDVPFGIAQWEITGTAEIDMNFEHSVISVLELAQALYNPVSAYDTLNKAVGMADDHTLTVPIQQTWVYYPTLEDAYSALEHIEEVRQQQKTATDIVLDVLF